MSKPFCLRASAWSLVSCCPRRTAPVPSIARVASQIAGGDFPANAPVMGHWLPVLHHGKAVRRHCDRTIGGPTGHILPRIGSVKQVLPLNRALRPATV